MSELLEIAETAILPTETHKRGKEFMLGPVKVVMSGCEHDLAAIERAEQIMDLATKILRGPTFADLAGIEPGEKPCGCSGS